MMESFFRWLETPEGIGMAHAVIALTTATAAVLSAWAARLAAHNKTLLDNHIRRHGEDRS